MRRLHPHIYIVSAVPYMICIGNLVCRTRVHYSYEIFQTSVVRVVHRYVAQPASSAIKIHIIFSFVFFRDVFMYNDTNNIIYNMYMTCTAMSYVHQGRNRKNFGGRDPTLF